MNQRVALRAFIEDKGRILLLRRSSGRPSIIGKYELPGGRLKYGDHPEDTIQDCIESDTGLTVRSMQIYDVVTYVDHDDRDIQYVFVVYNVKLTNASRELLLSQNYDKHVWISMSDIQQEELTESTKILLGMVHQTTRGVKTKELIGNDVVANATGIHDAIIYSDGASRGNPGPSASGYIIMDSNENILHEGGMYLGITTSNQAEYHGVRLGLEKALKLGVRTIDFRIDSSLVVNQLNGFYSIKNRELWPIHDRIKELISMFDKVTFTHVGREHNQLADAMVNKILNARIL